MKLCSEHVALILLRSKEHPPKSCAFRRYLMLDDSGASELDTCQGQARSIFNLVYVKDGASEYVQYTCVFVCVCQCVHVYTHAYAHHCKLVSVV